MAIFTGHSFGLITLLLSIALILRMGSTESTPGSSLILAPPPTHAPFPNATIIPLPSRFSDIPKEAIACWDSLIHYSVTSSFLDSQIRSAEIYTSHEFPTPITSTVTYDHPQLSCTTSYPGLTTLCDGYPRAVECIEHCKTTSVSTSTIVYTQTGTVTWLQPTWKTELQELQAAAPTCTPAQDLSPNCARMADAYTWRLNAVPEGSTTHIAEWHMRPGCAVLITPTPTATQARTKCSLAAESYEAYYWPSASSICSSPSNVTTPTATPTPVISANRAVTSSTPLASPSVQHVIHNVTVYTLFGLASSIGDGGSGRDVYSPSLTLPILTLTQHPSSLLVGERECHKPSPRGPTRCTLSYVPNFQISDIFSIGGSKYYGEELATKTTVTICQASYRPTIALPLSEIVAQNRIAEDCEWSTKRSGRTSIVGEVKDVVTFSYVDSEMYHAITTTRVEGLRETGTSKSGNRM